MLATTKRLFPLVISVILISHHRTTWRAGHSSLWKHIWVTVEQQGKIRPWAHHVRLRYFEPTLTQDLKKNPQIYNQEGSYTQAVQEEEEGRESPPKSEIIQKASH